MPNLKDAVAACQKCYLGETEVKQDSLQHEDEAIKNWKPAAALLHIAGVEAVLKRDYWHIV